MALDPATWTASGIATGEALVIAGLVVRRRRTERGRRLVVVVGYQGPDTTAEDTTTRPDPGAPPDPVTPPEYGPDQRPVDSE